LAKPTILIVEDDAILATVLTPVISRLGYEVAGPFAFGEEAMAFLPGQQVDLVLMDIELAGEMNGIATAQIIHQTSDIPVVFLTSNSQNLLFEQAKSVSPYGYLVKPVSEQMLAATLEMSLHRHKVDRELKESRNALAKSEEKFRTLAESSRDYIMRYDQAGRHIYMNPAALAVAGLTEADIIGKTHLESGFPEDQSRFWEEKIAQVFETAEPFQIEFSWESPAGLIYLDWRLTPEFDRQGRVQSVLGVSRDITGRKRVEEALRQSEKRLKLSEKIGKIGNWEYNIADHSIVWSEQTYYLFERDPEAGPPTADQERTYYSEEVITRIRGYAKKVIESGEPFEGFEFSASLASGRKPIFIGSMFPIHDAKGRVVKLFGTFQDITERRQAEQEKIKLAAQLYQAQKMEAIGTLAGGIAHDFNNILGAILGRAEMIQEDSPADSMIRKDIDQILKACHRAKDLVKQILAFSRQAEIEQIPLQPAIIIKEAVRMLRSSLPSTITIHQDIDSETGLILADPTQIHQVLMNLCTNAFHAMEETGGTLTISMHRKTLSRNDLVSEPHVQPGAFMQLSIGDTGPGIAPEIRERIFDPYFTTKQVGKGTGMGLAIIHGIVKGYKGFVTFHSRPGEGAVFHVYLPVIDDSAVVESETVPFAGDPLGTERILFIDDEEILLEVGRSMLERLGYRVTVRKNSLEALHTFQNHPDQFDLIITDQTMPGMIGSDMAQRMLQLRPDIPIILCTGYSNLISEEKAKSLGIKGFALKPLTKKNIASIIRKVLDQGSTSIVQEN
jgi:PAS domain S-box-containing protein